MSSSASCATLISTDLDDEAVTLLSKKIRVSIYGNLRSHTKLPTVETSWFLSTTRGVSSRKASRGL